MPFNIFDFVMLLSNLSLNSISTHFPQHNRADEASLTESTFGQQSIELDFSWMKLILGFVVSLVAVISPYLNEYYVYALLPWIVSFVYFWSNNVLHLIQFIISGQTEPGMPCKAFIVTILSLTYLFQLLSSTIVIKHHIYGVIAMRRKQRERCAQDDCKSNAAPSLFGISLRRNYGRLVSGTDAEIVNISTSDSSFETSSNMNVTSLHLSDESTFGDVSNLEDEDNDSEFQPVIGLYRNENLPDYSESVTNK